MADTFGDKAAHLEKTTIEASVMASATALTTSVSVAFAEMGIDATCLKVKACRIEAVRWCSSFSVCLCARSDAVTIVSSLRWAPAYASTTLWLSSAIKDLVIVGVGVVEWLVAYI